MDNKRARRPGDILLERYLPDADAAQRELARARLQDFARWLLAIARDQAEMDMQVADSRESDTDSTIERGPPTKP